MASGLPTYQARRPQRQLPGRMRRRRAPSRLDAGSPQNPRPGRTSRIHRQRAENDSRAPPAPRSVGNGEGQTPKNRATLVRPGGSSAWTNPQHENPHALYPQPKYHTHFETLHPDQKVILKAATGKASGAFMELPENASLWMHTNAFQIAARRRILMDPDKMLQTPTPATCQVCKAEGGTCGYDVQHYFTHHACTCPCGPLRGRRHNKIRGHLATWLAAQQSLNIEK